MNNRSVYENKRVISEYVPLHFLHKPELAVLNKYEDKIRRGKMLDIGIGAGRTTHYFSDVAGEYVGIDYSEGMIETCRKIFPGKRFEVCDVCGLGGFRTRISTSCCSASTALIASVTKTG